MVALHCVYQECGQIQWKVGAYPGEVSPVRAALCGTSLWGESHPKSRFMGKIKAHRLSKYGAKCEFTFS